MPTDLTAILGQMQARCEAATPGPWLHPIYGGAQVLTGDDWNCICSMYPRGDQDMRMAHWEDGRGPHDEQSNAAFIAHARTDLPNAIAGLRVAVEALDSVRRFGQISEEVHIAMKAIREALGGGQ